MRDIASFYSRTRNMELDQWVDGVCSVAGSHFGNSMLILCHVATWSFFENSLQFCSQLETFPKCFILRVLSYLLSIAWKGPESDSVSYHYWEHIVEIRSQAIGTCKKQYRWWPALTDLEQEHWNCAVPELVSLLTAQFHHCHLMPRSPRLTSYSALRSSLLDRKKTGTGPDQDWKRPDHQSGLFTFWIRRPQKNRFSRTGFDWSSQNRHTITFSYLLPSKHTKNLTNRSRIEWDIIQTEFECTNFAFKLDLDDISLNSGPICEIFGVFWWQ